MITCPVCKDDVELAGDRIGLHGDCPGGVAFTALADTDQEARYTPPSQDCPHPERWHSKDWDSAETEVTDLVAAFVKALRPDVVVETGTAFAQTAEAVGWVLRQAGVGHLHTIEIDPERVAAARTVCKGLPVTVHETSSLDYDPPDGIGFAWFDSLFDLRVPEFRRYYPKMAPHAIVGFHDTAPHFPVWPQIEQLEAEGLLLPIRLATPRGVVFGEVV